MTTAYFTLTNEAFARMTTADINTLFDMIPDTFKSVDYMAGQLEGLCFGEQVILSIKDVESIINNNGKMPRRVKIISYEE